MGTPLVLRNIARGTRREPAVPARDHHYRMPR
jgi:hypothetical protein